jgi:hypothetical protein
MVDVRKVEASKRLSSGLRFRQIVPYLAEQWQAGQDSNLLLSFLIETVLLRRYKIEERFRPSVQIVQACL